MDYAKLLLLIPVLGMICIAGISPAQAKELTIFHAGSLAVPMQKMEKEFEKRHKGIDVQRQAGGSTKMARLISEVGKKADIMAAADYHIIDNYLIPKFATWNIRFATNQMVLAYTDSSKYSDKLSSNIWYNILQKEGVSWGYSDPNLDPCGYRALMVMQLAEKYYGIHGLYDKLLSNRPQKNIRPKSVELVHLLETGHMDYAWEYLSVAVQHDLNYIKLNPHINLSNYKYDDFYNTAQVQVSGKEPGTKMTKRGKSITYGVTMTTNAQHPQAAKLFLQYMLDPKGGLRVLQKKGQPPIEPPKVPSRDMLNHIPKDIAQKVEVIK